MNAVSFGNYRLKIDERAIPENSGIYIITNGQAGKYPEFGYNVKIFDNVSVSVKKKL